MSAHLRGRQILVRTSCRLGRSVVLLLAAALLVLGAACQSTTSAAGQAGGAATSATPAGGAVVAPKAGQPSAPDAKPADTKPGTSKPADARPSAAKPGGAVEGDRERIAERATWAPGSLESHFEKHGREGPYRSAAEYDRAARDTIRTGTAFTYQDRESNARRQGYYDKTGNRFTGLTRDGARITTHFRPDRGEAYVRGLEDSTYR